MSIYTFASAIFSITIVIVFFIFSRLFSEITIFYIGIPFALSMFMFSSASLHRDSEKDIFKTAHVYISKILIVGLTTSSVLAVLTIPPYTGSILDWINIPWINLLRYIASLLLTTFFPGYFLLKMIDKKCTFTGSIVIILSYLLSSFLMFLTGFFLLLSGNTISSLGPITVVAINLMLMVIYHFTYYTWKNDKNPPLTITLNWLETGLIPSLLVVVVTGALFTMFCNLPLTPGDMQDHHGLAIQYLNGFPLHGEKLVPSYPYLFHIILAVMFSLSGIPSALSEQGLFILSLMPVLTFYCAIKTWFNKKEDQKIPSTALLLSILLGFGGLYAIYSRFTNPAYDILQLLANTTIKTYDIGMRCLYIPDIVAPIWNIGLPTFFALLYFLKKDVTKITKAILIPILVALGYLGHISETFIFILILLIYVLLSKPDNEKNIGPYIILGLIITAFIDLAAPAQIYVFSSSGTGNIISLPYLASLLLAILAYIMELLKDRHVLHLTTKLRKSLLKVSETSWGYGKWVMLYTYTFFVIVWLTLQNDFNLWEWGGYYFTPFFVFPLRLGPVGLLAIITVFVYFPKIIRDKRLLFFLLLIPTGFVMEQASSYYPLFYPAYRYATLTFIGACITAAYGITMLLKKTLNSPSIIRRISTYTLISVLIISGFLSTTLYYVNATYYSKHWDMSAEEEAALCYIRQYTSTNSSVLTFTEESANRLRNFAGLNPVQDAQRWSKLLLSTSNPYIITYVLGSSNVKYIYVAQRDVELLNSNNVLSSFVDYFPKVFKSDCVTVYEVPLLTPPSPEASVAVLNLLPSLQESEDAMWIDDSFTEGWYAYRQYGEIKSYEVEVRDGIAEISVTSNQSGIVWASYALSGLALNTTNCSVLSFRYRVANNFAWFTIQLWNSSNNIFYYVGHLTDKDFTTKTFSLPESQIVTKIEIIVETPHDSPVNTTACAYIDYIKFSPQVLSWKDDTFLRDWACYAKYGSIFDWSAHSDGDILKMNVTSNQSGTVWISYSLPVALKTKDSILSFRYKVDNDYSWFTIILQNASHKFFYKGHLTDRTFTTKSYSLPDDQIITRVEIIVETTDKAPVGASAIAYLDYIKISQKPFSEDDVFPSLFVSSLHTKYVVLYVDNVLMENLDAYLSHYTHILLTSDPPIPVETVSKWVSTGNTLTVLNTHGNGFFANLLGINTSSPLLLTKNLGLGKVLYVNSFPIIEAGKEYELLQLEFLEKVREALTLDEYVHRVNVLPVYNSTFGSIEINGDFSISTDILTLQGSVDLTDPPFQFNKSTEIKIYGEVNLTIKNASLLIFPSESYMLIKPESYPVESEVLVGGSEALIVADTNVIYNSDVPVSFKFKTTGLSLYARLPSINASGAVTFDQLDVHAALYIPLAGIVQQRAEVRGSVKFDTMHISNPLIIFSMFQADGEILNLAETTSRPTIPWNQVLTSPYNLAFNVIFLLGVAICIVKKRKAKTTINEKVM